MNSLVPDIYKKSIFDINYKNLKEKHNIKVLLYDFDNTIIEKGNYEVNKKTKDLFSKLSKDFIIYIVSNSTNKKKLDKISKELNLPYIGASMKPFPRGYNKLKFKSVKNNEIAMIGDQLLTDILGANKKGYLSILVDPVVENKEVIFTKINRIFENRIFNNKKNKLNRGNYYD